MVESMDRMVESAGARVKASEAKIEYAERYLSRMQQLAKTSATSDDEVDKARVAQVEASVQ